MIFTFGATEATEKSKRDGTKTGLIIGHIIVTTDTASFGVVVYGHIIDNRAILNNSLVGCL